MAIYLADARAMGVNVLQPDINESVADFTAVGDNVRFGLQAIRNVGLNVIDSLVATRKEKGKFASFSDFLEKVELPVCNKRAVDSLIKGGAFDSLGHTRRGLVSVAESAIDSVIGVKRQAGIGQDDLFGLIDDGAPAVGLDFTIDEREWPRKELLSTEREMLGLYVSSHPLDGTERILARSRDLTIADLLASEGGPQNNDIAIAGMITRVERKIAKSSGNPWALVVLEDKDASIEVTFFAQAYMTVATELLEDLVVSVRGRLNEREGSFTLMGREMTVLDVSGVSEDGTAPVTISLPVSRVVPELAMEMRKILSTHPGTTPVHMR